MHGMKQMSLAEAERIGDILGVDWNQIVVKQFRTGIKVELVNHARDPESNITEDEILISGKIALARLAEFSDYYTSLSVMEKEADDYWANV